MLNWATSFWISHFNYNLEFACELTEFFSQMDQSFPTATLKWYLKCQGLGFRADVLGLG